MTRLALTPVAERFLRAMPTTGHATIARTTVAAGLPTGLGVPVARALEAEHLLVAVASSGCHWLPAVIRHGFDVVRLTDIGRRWLEEAP